MHIRQALLDPDEMRAMKRARLVAFAGGSYPQLGCPRGRGTKMTSSALWNWRRELPFLGSVSLAFLSRSLHISDSYRISGSVARARTMEILRS